MWLNPHGPEKGSRVTQEPVELGNMTFPFYTSVNKTPYISGEL